MTATREQALRIAQRLGCYGAHQNVDGAWMPCPDAETLKSVIAGEAPRGRIKRKSVMVERAERAASVSGKLFPTRDEALRESKKNGCSTVRTVKINGTTMYASCMPKNNGRPENTGMISPAKNDFEPLGEGGVLSIETLPSGGLVSGKSLEDLPEVEIDAKSFVNYVSRSSDPDVYTDPDSARKRARQLGCIGIRRYTASDGKTVWMPCTNGSDYNRAMDVTPAGYRRTRRGAKSEYSDIETKGRRKLAQTPAPKKDRIFGSGLNPKGSARSASSASEISMDSQTVNSLAEKVRKHNADMKKANKESWSRTNLRALKAVYRRGAGAFSVSHRPGMNRNQWALGRVNAFLKILSSGKPSNAAYRGDNDLLPKGHPWKKKGIAGKSFLIGDNEYFAEQHIEGTKIRKGIERKVTRYIASNLGAPEANELHEIF